MLTDYNRTLIAPSVADNPALIVLRENRPKGDQKLQFLHVLEKTARSFTIS
jgi:hypothetical protein